MAASKIWYWPRNIDGSLDTVKASKAYVGSNNQQAAVTKEVATTMIDLNTNAEAIVAMQRQKKVTRIFYSKTSVMNKSNHMDDVFDLYEKLNFNGLPIGFVTKDILNQQNNNDWKVVLVRKTEFVTKEEFNALQEYLNKGGIVIIDNESLKKNEYGEPLNVTLNSGKGRIVIADSLAPMVMISLQIIKITMEEFYV